jgi:hypothetical protein
MRKPPIARPTIAMAVSAAIILPIAICLLLGAASLLSGMGDGIGGGALRWIALGGGIVWALDLILLVIAIGMNSLSEADAEPDEEENG